jgi:hypothetical protein
MSVQSEILAAHFTLSELERMMDVAVRAAEAQLQQQQQPATAAAIPSGEDGALTVEAQVLEPGRPKQDEQAEADINPDIPEWMR